MLLGDQLAVAATMPGRRGGDGAVVVLVAGPTAATGVDLVVDDETFPVVVPVALAADGPAARREFGGECRPSANHRVPPRPGVAVPPASHSGGVDGRGTLRRVGRRDQYRTELSALPVARWPGYLRERSGLPGARANLELAQAVADAGDAGTFAALIATDDEYLVLCGVIGRWEEPDRLREHATDGRWRGREGVAMALQRIGDADPPRLVDLVTEWAADPHPLVQRAAVAGICEPRLLKDPDAARQAVEICARVTRSLTDRPAGDRADAGVRALRQALGYCWSVAVAADPAGGLPAFRALDGSGDGDVAWIVRENSRKARLATLL